MTWTTLIMHLQRRSQELTSLGFSPKVDPASLQLSVEINVGDWQFTIGTDRLGNFRVQRAENSGSEMTATSAHSFELSEFRERRSLETYLIAMFEGAVETQKVNLCCSSARDRSMRNCHGRLCQYCPRARTARRR